MSCSSIVSHYSVQYFTRPDQNPAGWCCKPSWGRRQWRAACAVQCRAGQCSSHLRSGQEFIHEDPEGPEVHRPVVSLHSISVVGCQLIISSDSNDQAKGFSAPCGIFFYFVHLIEDNLRCDILRRPTECPRLFSALKLLGETKVDHLDVALGVWQLFIWCIILAHIDFLGNCKERKKYYLS